jgi:predicted MFS family arabinose efflux permease
MLSRINGFQMAAGGLGALAATTPVAWALNTTDWRGLFWVLGLLSFAVALAVFLMVPEQKETTEPETLHLQITGVIQVFKSSAFWRIAPLTTLSQSGYIALQGLWAGPWLRDVADIPKGRVPTVLSWSALAMIAGFIFLGFIAEKLARRGVPVLTTAVIGMGLFIGVQTLMTFTVPLPIPLLLVLFGFFGTSGILSYTALTLEFPKRLSGRVTTSINMMVFVAAFGVQWAIGAIINCWEVSAQGHYDPAGYRAGFMAVLFCQVLALIWFWIAGINIKRIHKGTRS